MTAEPVSIPSVQMRDGHSLPLLGLGTYQMRGLGCSNAVESALVNGYRLIDTANMYGNEADVATGIRASGVPREDIVLESKLNGSDHTRAREALETSLRLLETDYLDVYLIHWPNPKVDRYVQAWTDMVAAQQEGLVRSIGVSNFKPAHIEKIAAATGVWPALNQIQMSPVLARHEIREYHDEHDIITQAWGPLGHREGLPDDTVMKDVANEVGRDPRMVALRWCLQQGATTLAKSVLSNRQRENADIFSWSLPQWAMTQLASLDRGEDQAIDSDEVEHL